MGKVIEWPLSVVGRRSWRCGNTRVSVTELVTSSAGFTGERGGMIGLRKNEGNDDNQGGKNDPSEASTSAKRSSIFDGLIASLKSNRTPANDRTKSTAPAPVSRKSSGFDLRNAEVADPDTVMELDPRTEVLMCVYDKGSPDPTLTVIRNADGTRTLLADGRAVARLSVGAFEVAEVVLYQRNV